MFDIVQCDLLERGVAGQGAVNIWSCLSVSVHRYGIYCIGISAHGQYVANTADYHDYGTSPSCMITICRLKQFFSILFLPRSWNGRKLIFYIHVKKRCHAVALVGNMNVHTKGWRYSATLWSKKEGKRQYTARATKAFTRASPVVVQYVVHGTEQRCPQVVQYSTASVLYHVQ